MSKYENVVAPIKVNFYSLFWMRPSQYETDSPINLIMIFHNMCSVLDLFNVTIDTFKVKKLSFFISYNQS